MQNRAQHTVFWPDTTLNIYVYDIEAILVKFQICNLNSPSQLSIPYEEFDPPKSPFERIFIDFQTF